MKKIILVLLAMVILSGCSTTNISQVEAKLQKSQSYAIRDSLQKGDTTTYYYYAFYGGGGGYWGGRSGNGWYCWEFTCDKNGNILKRREYWIGSDKGLEEFRKNLK